MGLFDFLKRSNDSKQPAEPNIEFENLGILESICPYCNVPLEKRPTRKTKCKKCSKHIFVRTRPSDRKKVLVTDMMAAKIDLQWKYASMSLEEKQAYEDERIRLRNKFGAEPSPTDINWSLLNSSILAHSSAGDWGLYRNARYQQAELLYDTQKFQHALIFFLEVSYLDLNGPNNLGGFSSQEVLKEFPPFDPKMGFLAPAVMSVTKEILGLLRYDEYRAWKEFEKMALNRHKNLKLRLSPQEAWEKLKGEILNDKPTKDTPRLKRGS